jgi:integrase
MPRKYGFLLAHDDVRRWYENLRARSAITADVYLRTLGYYCALTSTTPAAILEVARTAPKPFRDGFIDFVRQLERDGKAGSYITRFKKVLRSWLRFNDVTVGMRVNIAGEYATPTIDMERIPSKDELGRIFRMASPRARVSIALMAFSGLRPHSLGNYSGTDGLRLGDFPEAELTATSITFPTVPSPLRIRWSLSKARHQYLTFITDQTITYVQEYLDHRVQHGERFDEMTSLLGFDPRGHRRNPFLRTTLVTRDIKAGIVKAGYRWRPYVLRAYFDTNLLIAENQGKVSHSYLQFFMGHQGDMEARYTTHKGRLPQDLLDDMRASFGACVPYLSTIAPSLEQSTIVKEAKIEALKSIAKSLLGIDLLEVKVAKERELERPLDADEAIALFENTIQRQREAAEEDPQIVIREEDLEAYLLDGWEFVSVLPSQRILIRK